MVTEIMLVLCCSFMWESARRRTIITEMVVQVEVTRTESMLVQQKMARYRPTSSLLRGPDGFCRLCVGKVRISPHFNARA